MSEEKDLRKGQKAYLQGVVNEFKRLAQLEIDAIAKLKNQLIKGQDGQLSVLQEFSKAKTDLESKIEEIEEVYNSVFSADEDDVILADEVDRIKDEVIQKESEIQESLERVKNFETTLFGKTLEDGTQTEGAKQKVDSLINQLQGLHKSNSERQEQLFDKIEGMLKGASTVALASAFAEHKKSFEKSNGVWLTIFILAIGSMMFLSIWAFKSSNGQVNELWKYSLVNLPFLAGAVWLAIFASKQRSQNKRLQQEYAFKEDVAKVYYGLKQEINELGKSDIGARLNEQVLKVMVETVSYNPSQTLDNNSHLDRGPILESLASIAKTLKDTQGK